MDAELLTGDQTSRRPHQAHLLSHLQYEVHQQKPAQFPGAVMILRRSYLVVCFPRSGVGTGCDLVASKGAAQCICYPRGERGIWLSVRPPPGPVFARR